MKKAVPITTRAFIQRISRALVKQGKIIKKSRTTQMVTSLGEYYIVDIQGGYISAQNVDIISLGKELKILKPYEKIED